MKAERKGDLTVDVLGTAYTITYRKGDEDPILSQGNAGYCDPSVKLIVMEDAKEDPRYCKDQDVLDRKTMRHELIHAFAFESGLGNDSGWAVNEEMIGFFAWQFPKMAKAFRAVGALDGGEESV